MTAATATMKVFSEDEMALSKVEKTWDAEELLAQEGIFFLKDILNKLGLDSVKVKRRARDIEKNGRNAWEVMGVRKIWTHWVVRMKVFAPYYSDHLIPMVKEIDKSWDGNSLLKQDGVFYLTDVCNFIPFTTHQLRYQAKKNPSAKEEYGIWKDEDLNVFLVDMTPFSKWIKGLWMGDYR